MTRKELELHIVRLAERYPDRVGLPHALTDRHLTGAAECTDHCIMGQILHDIGSCGRYSDEFLTTDMIAFVSPIVLLNNAGVPWGEFPRRLGLTPGEAPPEPPTEPVEAPVTVPGSIPVDEPSKEEVLA